MELDDMKAMWQQYDKTLQENKILNEQMISMMLEGKSKSALRGILYYEYAGLVMCFILAIIYLLMFNTVTGNTILFASYIASFAFIIAGIIMFYFKYRLLSTLDFGRSAVSTTARNIERFRLLVSKERMWSIAASPLIITSTMVVMAKWVRDIDVMDMPDVFLPRILLGIAALIIALLVVYRLLYFNSIQKIKANLQEIENFRS